MVERQSMMAMPSCLVQPTSLPHRPRRASDPAARRGCAARSWEAVGKCRNCGNRGWPAVPRNRSRRGERFAVSGRGGDPVVVELEHVVGRCH
jgi:hypothetical protein